MRLLPILLSLIISTSYAADAVSLVKRFEGLRLTQYTCPGGMLTIGYGHSTSAKTRMTITERMADSLLARDIRKAERLVNRYVKVPLKPHQKAALTSFAFNVNHRFHVTKSGKTPKFLRLLNRGDYVGCANELLKWKFANGKPLRGLLARRIEERRIFLGET